MEFGDKIKEIKKALLEGGLVVASRGAGKTTAIAEILMEDENAFVVVPNKGHMDNMVFILVRKGLSRTEAQHKVILAETVNHGHYYTRIHTKSIYVDEFFTNTYKGPFKAATGSWDFTVKVIK
jgi:DNA transposition AAA+ family ATPase